VTLAHSCRLGVIVTAPVTFAGAAACCEDGRASELEDGEPFMLPTMALVPLVVLVSAIVVNVMVVEAGKDVEVGEDVEVRLRLKEIAALIGRLEDV